MQLKQKLIYIYVNVKEKGGRGVFRYTVIRWLGQLTISRLAQRTRFLRVSAYTLNHVTLPISTHGRH